MRRLRGAGSLISRKLSPSGSSQRPTVHVAPRYSETYGDLASKLAADYGLNPDEWQRFILDDWLARTSGSWASLTCGLAVPRQNGKNALIEVRELFGMVGLGERILHTAHEVKTAQKHFRRLKHFFGTRAEDPAAMYPELNALVENVRSVNGQEAIYLKNGGSIELVARSKNSGRGFTVDVLIMDEAQEMGEDALEALMPTTSAAPLGNPQWIFTGTPPGPSASGEVFTRVREEALSDKPGKLSWHEWSVVGEVDLDDRVLWRMTNPALDSGRLQEAVIEGERSRFSDGGFARERLGRWPQIGSSSRRWSAEFWQRGDTDAPPESGVRSFAVAFAQDGQRLSLSGAVKHADGVHVELIDAFQGVADRGVDPLADWLAERWHDTSLIAIAGAAGAALKAALRERGVPDRVIHVMTTTDYFAANTMTEDALKAQTVTHPIGGEGDVLNMSVAVCDGKKRGQNGQWGWFPTVPDGDETPVEAFCAAYWAARTSKRVPGRKQVLI